jgi:hypothetical protein
MYDNTVSSHMLVHAMAERPRKKINAIQIKMNSVVKLRGKVRLLFNYDNKSFHIRHSEDETGGLIVKSNMDTKSDDILLEMREDGQSIIYARDFAHVLVVHPVMDLTVQQTPSVVYRYDYKRYMDSVDMVTLTFTPVTDSTYTVTCRDLLMVMDTRTRELMFVHDTSSTGDNARYQQGVLQIIYTPPMPMWQIIMIIIGVVVLLVIVVVVAFLYTRKSAVGV